VIAGSAGCGGEAGYIRMLAVRLLPDGRLDPTFGGDGTWTSSAGCDASGVVVQPDGKLLIGGQTGDNEYCEGGTMLLLRLHPDGSFDRAFGDDGERTIRFPDVGQAGAAALALDPRNRAVLAGYAGRRIAVARVRRNGRPDRAFGDRGRITAALSRHAVYESATGVAVGTAGQITVSATSYRRRYRSRFAVLRLRPSGRPDRPLGRDGAPVVGFASHSEGASDVTIDQTGRALLVGTTQRERTRRDFAVARMR
jgi:uncharacterized delta-60 repeat protein